MKNELVRARFRGWQAIAGARVGEGEMCAPKIYPPRAASPRPCSLAGSAKGGNRSLARCLVRRKTPTHVAIRARATLLDPSAASMALSSRGLTVAELKAR
jgi:hypothetical protein